MLEKRLCLKALDKYYLLLTLKLKQLTIMQNRLFSILQIVSVLDRAGDIKNMLLLVLMPLLVAIFTLILIPFLDMSILFYKTSTIYGLARCNILHLFIRDHHRSFCFDIIILCHVPRVSQGFDTGGSPTARNILFAAHSICLRSGFIPARIHLSQYSFKAASCA
jgi:hypothetical protein